MSIFSRLKKPAPAETKPTAEASPKSGGTTRPPGSAESSSKGEEPRRAVEPPAAPAPNGKSNGVHPSPKPAAITAAPAAKPNGHATERTRVMPAVQSNGTSSDPNQGIAAAIAAVAAVKQPDLSATIAYGAPAPARAAVERPPVVAPATPPPAPVPVHEPARGSLDLAIAMALGEPPAAIADGTSTASDQAALQATFEDLAVPYMAEVRSVMLEVQYGEVQSTWLEQTRPVLKSLRKMAVPVGNNALVEGLDKFDAALAEALAPGQPPTASATTRDALLAAYAPLRACLPRAFELDGERDRREPLIVSALLEQVPGLEPLMIEKMMAAGFGKLSALYAARADELAAVTGIPATIAAATAARIQAFRRSTPAGLASVDLGGSLREIARWMDTLRGQNDAYEAAARGWSEKDRASKNQLRRERQMSFLQITIELVRLGEVDLSQRIAKLPFARKIEEIDRMVNQAQVSAKAKNRLEGRTTAGAAAAT